MRNIQHLPNFVSLNEIPNNFFKNIKKVLIVYSLSSKKNKVLKKFKLQLKLSHVSYFNASKLKFNSDIIDYKSKLFNPGYDLIISIGGGNVIDASKIIYARSIFLNWRDKIKNNLIKLNNSKTKFMVVSTLPGSGAEVSKTAVLNSKNDKIFFTSGYFIPNYVFYDVKSIYSVDRKKLLIRLVDAITHSIESKNSILTNLISEAYSDYVIKNSIEFINYILKTKNKYLSTSEIKKLCIFSLYGGMAQSETGSGLCHALAHTLEKNYKLPHSEAIFLCLMISLKYKRSSKNHKKDLLIF